MKKGTLAALAAASLMPTGAHAAVYQVHGNGSVASIMALRDGAAVAAPEGAIHIGDLISFSFTFDTDEAQLQSLFDADPTVNIYYLPVTDFSAYIGPYKYINDSRYVGNASFQLWNDHDVVGPVDSQSFSFNGRGPNQLPFDTGIGQTLEGFTISAFDSTALARDNDLISTIVPFAEFGNRSFSWLQYNVDESYSVHVGGSFSGTISIAAVPEPSTWAMLVFGFGLIGAAARHGRKVAISA